MQHLTIVYAGVLSLHEYSSFRMCTYSKMLQKTLNGYSNNCCNQKILFSRNSHSFFLIVFALCYGHSKMIEWFSFVFFPPGSYWIVRFCTVGNNPTIIKHFNFVQKVRLSIWSFSLTGKNKENGLTALEHLNNSLAKIRISWVFSNFRIGAYVSY